MAAITLASVAETSVTVTSGVLTSDVVDSTTDFADAAILTAALAVSVTIS